MVPNLYKLQWIVLAISLLFLLLVIISLFRKIKRDIIISFSLVAIFLSFFVFIQFLIDYQNSKANKYFGIHELENYNHSAGYKIEIKPNNQYIIFNKHDTAIQGKWLHIDSRNKTDILLIDGAIFGINELKIKQITSPSISQP